jgi:DNA-binding SARP family transcriptional activator
MPLNSRQSLAFLFWPDSTEKQSRNNLRKLNYGLRHSLPQAERYLDITTETLTWRMDSPYELDTSQLEAWSKAVLSDGSGMASQLALSKLS